MNPVAAARYAPTLLTWMAFAVAGLYPIDNPDTFGHLALGRQIAELGSVPELDTFSYFRGTPAPFFNYEWLSDWLLFVCFRAGGWNALHALKLAATAVLAYLLVRLAQLRSDYTGAWLVPLFTLACLPAIRFRLSVRPHLFGLVFAALLILGLSTLLTHRERRVRIAWIAGLALAHVCWVNLHGSHLFGLALVALALLTSLGSPQLRAEIAGLAALMVGASCISPYGPEIVRAAIEHSLDPRYRTLIHEWQAYRPGMSPWYPLILIWQICWLVAAFYLRPPRRSGPDACRGFEALYSLLLLLMAARSLRFYADAAALTVPAIAAGLGPLVTRFRRLGRVQRHASALTAGLFALWLAVSGCLALPPQDSFGFGVSTRGRPAASAQWLGEHLPRARIFGTMSDSWDLMFSLPQARFLVDGRSTLYGPEHLQRMRRAWASPEALRELLDETRTDVVVVPQLVTETQTALRTLLSSPDFRLVLIEAEHCVFARTLSERRALLQHRSLRVLRPNYDAAWLLAAELDAAAVRSELSLLPRHPNVAAYRSWVEAMLALRPLARAQGQAGLSEPSSQQQHGALLSALRGLRESDRALGIVQTVTAYRALAAVSACQLSEADAAFARARAFGEVREIALGTQELALRRGQDAAVAGFLKAAQALPQAKGDPWLAALARELDRPTLCDAR